jgi:hypothetical protein
VVRFPEGLRANIGVTEAPLSTRTAATRAYVTAKGYTTKSSAQQSDMNWRTGGGGGPWQVLRTTRRPDRVTRTSVCHVLVGGIHCVNYCADSKVLIEVKGSWRHHHWITAQAPKPITSMSAAQGRARERRRGKVSGFKEKRGPALAPTLPGGSLTSAH